MKKRFSKSIIMLIITALVFPFQIGFVSNKAEASITDSLAINGNIIEWILDEGNDVIYALTDAAEDNLLRINASDLTLDKKRTIASSPSDIELDNGKLYIPLSATTQISVVDAVYLTDAATIATAGSRLPYRIAVDDNQVFYVEEDSYSYLYEIKIVEATETQVDANLYNEADLTIDKVNNLIYLGESGSTGSDLVSYDTTTLTRVSISDYQDGYGFNFPHQRVHLNGDHVFYAGRQFNKLDLTEIEGDYEDIDYFQNEIIAVNDQYVVTDSSTEYKTSIFDRNRFIKITDLDYETSSVLLDSANRIFTFNRTNKTIDVVNVDLTLPAYTYTVEDNKLALDYPISDMVFSEASNQLIAVSNAANKLIKVNSSDLSITEEKWIGSMPSQVSLNAGKIYVSLFGSTQIAVTDDVYGAAVSHIELAQNPYRIAVGADKIFYIPEFDGSGARYLYVYDRGTGSTQEVTYSNVPYKSFYQSDLYFDDSTNTLFVGESSNSGNDLYTVVPDATSYTVTTILTGLEYQYADRGVVQDGDDFYFADRRLDYSTYTVEYDYNEHVIYAKDGKVFTPTKAYLGTTEQFDLPFTIDNAQITDSGVVFLYSSEKGGIYRYNSIDEIKVPRAVAQNLDFTDIAEPIGEIRGAVNWDAADDESYIDEYVIYLTDGNGIKLNELGRVSKGQSSYTFFVSANTSDVPGANIAVYTKNQYAESMNTIAVRIWEEPNDVVEASFIDTDPNSGINGTYQWSAITPTEDAIAGYRVFYIDKDMVEVGTATNVAKGTTPYELQMNSSSLPAGAASIAITASNAYGETSTKSSRFLTRLYDLTVAEPLDIRSEATIPAVRSLGYLNNVYDTDPDAGQLSSAFSFVPGSDDTTSTHFKAYFVNDSNQKLANIATIDRVFFGGYSITIPMNTDIFNGATKIGVYAATDSTESSIGSYLSIQDLGASDQVTPSPVVEVPEDTNDTDPLLSTDPVEPTDNEGVNGGVSLQGQSTTGVDGIITVIATLGESDFLEWLNQPEPSTSNTFVVDVLKQGNVITTQLSGKILQSISNINESVAIEVRTQNGTLHLPPTVIQQAIQRLGGNLETANISVSISEVSVERSEQINHFFYGISAVALLKPIDFSVTVTLEDGTQQEISEFTTFIGRTLTLPETGELYNLGNLTGVMYNPELNEYFPVPTIIENMDGVIRATLYRQGNSIYTVINNEKTFHDVPEDYYARASIDMLASRLILKGYEDDTYRHKTELTRAEFATMLIRALGILPTNKQTKEFKDIASSAWYTPSINAAVNAGLVSGYVDGSFRPNQIIKRQEMVVMIHKALLAAGYNREMSIEEQQENLESYKDSNQIKDWSLEAAAIAAREGIIKGMSPDTFAPNSAVDRGQAAEILYRTLKTLNFVN